MPESGSGSGPAPLIRFKIYPGDAEKSNAYFEVLIFRNRADFWRHLPDARRKRALAYLGDHGAKGSKLGEFIIGGMNECTDNTVSHELTHAAVMYAQHFLGRDLFTYWGEECLATLVGDMVSQFWRSYCDQAERTYCYGFFEKVNTPQRVKRG